MTKYVILKSHEGVGTEGELAKPVAWAVVDSREASGVKVAIRGYLNENADDDGTYVAVPARSFKPTTVTAETKTQLRFS